MPAKTRTRGSVCEDVDSFGYNIPLIGQSQSASSSRTFLNYDGLNFDGWSPKGCPVLPLHSSAPGTRSASVSEMPSPKSPSKLSSSKGLNFLKVHLNKRRSSDLPENARPPTRSASPWRLQETTTASIDAQFADNLQQDGKIVPRFTKRMPSIRTAVRKYESMAFRQRFMALPEEVRNKVYDYVIDRDTPEESIWSPLEHCGAGFVDCSRGIITLDAGDHADILYLDEIPVSLHSRQYGALSPTSFSSHTSCASPSNSYGTPWGSSRTLHKPQSIQPPRPQNPKLQCTSKDGRLHVRHVDPVPLTWPKYVRKGDTLWKELMRRWGSHEDAKVTFTDDIDIFARQNSSSTTSSDSEAQSPHSEISLPPLFESVTKGSLQDITILQQAHTLHLNLTLYEIEPLACSPPKHPNPTEPNLFSAYTTPRGDDTTHPLTQAVRYIVSSLSHLSNLRSISLNLTLYPGPIGDTTSHGYDKYFTTWEEIDALWAVLAPLKRVEGMDSIVVARLGSCVRWGRRGSSLFPEGKGLSVVENEAFPSDW
ncbi:hypothetical protein EG327_010804 [Venturia inaequalis]|uniref:Uncharacterized protein n=1 Tax=Venturia inaequalis TaxID=5025 RepID=A0A8H3VS31_VENIN|nr:hypothetical protein EG327_010804 [Venturia inaequalis]